MNASPSPLPENARKKIADALNARLADGLDLHSQIKVAHWNIKGPQFAALHPLFETFAVSLASAQRRDRRARGHAGRQAYGTARHVGQGLAPARVPAGDHARPRAREAPAPSASRTTSTGSRESRASAEKHERHRHGRPAHRRSSPSSRSTPGSCARPSANSDPPARLRATAIIAARRPAMDGTVPRVPTGDVGAAGEGRRAEPPGAVLLGCGTVFAVAEASLALAPAAPQPQVPPPPVPPPPASSARAATPAVSTRPATPARPGPRRPGLSRRILAPLRHPRGPSIEAVCTTCGKGWCPDCLRCQGTAVICASCDASASPSPTARRRRRAPGSALPLTDEIGTVLRYPFTDATAFVAFAVVVGVFSDPRVDRRLRRRLRHPVLGGLLDAVRIHRHQPRLRRGHGRLHARDQRHGRPGRPSPLGVAALLAQLRPAPRAHVPLPAFRRGAGASGWGAPPPSSPRPRQPSAEPTLSPSRRRPDPRTTRTAAATTGRRRRRTRTRRWMPPTRPGARSRWCPRGPSARSPSPCYGSSSIPRSPSSPAASRGAS